MKKLIILFSLVFLVKFSFAQKLKLPEGGEYFEWRHGANKHTLGYTGMKITYIQKCNPSRDSVIKTGLLQFNRMQFFDTCIFGKQQFIIVDSIWKETKVTFFDKKSATTYLSILQNKDDIDIEKEQTKNSISYFWRTKAEAPRSIVLHRLVIKNSGSYYHAHVIRLRGIPNPSF